MFSFVVEQAGKAGVDFPSYTTPPRTSFRCRGRENGYYADAEAGCQAYHVCHNGRKHDFVCPITTLFSESVKTCDYWYNVECVKEDVKAEETYESQSQYNERRTPPAPVNQIDRSRTSTTRKPVPKKTTTTSKPLEVTTTTEASTTTATEAPITTTTEQLSETTEKYVPSIRRETWTLNDPTTVAPTGSAFDMDMEKVIDKPSSASSNSEMFDGQDAPIQNSHPEEKVVSNPGRQIATQSVDEPGIFGSIPKYMLEEGKRALNETEEMIEKEYREVMRRLRKGDEPKGPNPYMPNHVSGFRSNADHQQTSGQPAPAYPSNELSTPTPLAEPPTLHGAAPYDYPIKSDGAFDQEYVSPGGQKPGWTMEPIPEESSRHLYVDLNHAALKPRKVIFHQESSDHPSPWMFPAKEDEITATAEESTTESGPKWVMASSTSDPLTESRRPSAPETGSAFDMDLKMTSTEPSLTVAASSLDPVTSNTIDGKSANERSSRSHVEAPMFREFIDGEMGLDGRCRCFVDPTVYFRR